MNDTIVGKPDFPLNNLRKLADQAGRFGITGSEGVKKFTEAIEKVNKQMSEEFTGDEDIFKSIEKL